MIKSRTGRKFLLLAMFVLALSSCIRDEIKPCPSLQVRIDVQDKNYYNIDFIEKNTGLDYRIDENLNFEDYIQKIFYVLYNLDTDEAVIVSHLHKVSDNANTTIVSFPEGLPFGRYRLIVWGNIESEKGILSDGRWDTYDLHSGSVEGYDVYMASEDFLYDEMHYDYTIKMKRLKGKLIIMAENFPDNIECSKKVVSNIMGNVDYNLQYSESENVVTERFWQQKTDFVSNTYVSPSFSSSGSKVITQIYKSSEHGIDTISLQPVPVKFSRNEITVLRYIYDKDAGTAKIYILVDDGWNEIINLEN